LAKRITDGWYDSLSSGTTLLALDAYATAGTDSLGKLSVAEVLRSNKSIKPLTLPNGLFPKTAFSEQAGALRLGNDSDLNAYYVIDQSGFDRKPPTTAIKQGMEVLREYTDADGKILTQVTMGEEINVHLKFRGLEGRSMGDIALVDLLPGGFELVVPSQPAQSVHEDASITAGDEEESEGENEQYEKEEVDASAAYSGWQCMICVAGNYSSLQYADLREDRVVFYAGIANDVQEIVYRIKATNVGKFTTPPAYGEAMYDRSVIARSAAGKLEVVRP
jgi:uncharacterized protein YfaS (alpha-2-macroglobulin family)